MIKQVRAVCFTGHRNFPIMETGKIIHAVECLILQGYNRFYSGGAYGFDLAAAQSVIYLKRKYPQTELFLILPCEKEKQTHGWSERNKKLYEYVLAEADHVSVLQEEAFCMQKRNQALVDAASCCLCWYQPVRERSGTGQTVRMAERKQIQILNLYLW